MELILPDYEIFIKEQYWSRNFFSLSIESIGNKCYIILRFYQVKNIWEKAYHIDKKIYDNSIKAQITKIQETIIQDLNNPESKELERYLKNK